MSDTKTMDEWKKAIEEEKAKKSAPKKNEQKTSGNTENRISREDLK